jgi:hypothetical protein
LQRVCHATNNFIASIVTDDEQSVEMVQGLIDITAPRRILGQPKLNQGIASRQVFRAHYDLSRLLRISGDGTEHANLPQGPWIERVALNQFEARIGSPLSAVDGTPTNKLLNLPRLVAPPTEKTRAQRRGESER